MATLIVRVGDREVRRCAIGERPVTVGRMSDNTIVIDTPTVSARHARIVRDGAGYVVEDLRSTNGTFVNDKPIARHVLQDGDVVLVGRHALSFTLADGEAAPAAPPREPPVMVPPTAIPAPALRQATLRVTAGKADRSEYVLHAVTTVIGASESAQIRTGGWFKPKVAAVVARRGDGFTITPMAGALTVNDVKVAARRELASGDVISVSGVTLEFTLV